MSSETTEAPAMSLPMALNQSIEHWERLAYGNSLPEEEPGLTRERPASARPGLEVKGASQRFLHP